MALFAAPAAIDASFMTKTALELRGRRARLADGTEVQVWVEQGEGGIAVAFLHEGSVIGRVTATRIAGHTAAELLAWTSSPWRRRGLASMAMAEVLEWAQDGLVPYLHGELPGTSADEAALAFLHASGLVTAIRTDASGRRFAALVPASTMTTKPASLLDRSAGAEAIAAVAAGASEPEAAALYRRLTGSVSRHPSTRVA
jgi:GNAT superfamily N-acetyltransferase